MAEKTAVKTERVIKSGGKKGDAIVEALRKDPSRSRKDLAELVGATTGRVGEVVRWLRDHGTKEEQALIGKHLESQPKREAAARPTKPAKKAVASKSGATKSAKPRGAAKKTAQAAKDRPAS